MDNQTVNPLYPTQTCTLCGEKKPTTRTNFGTKNNGKPRPWCRACSRKKTNEHAAKNREQRQARSRKRRALYRALNTSFKRWHK